MSQERKRRAVLSVYDKTGILELGRALVERGWELVSTGGTAGVLREGGLPVTGISEVTGHPEMMEGRVKTLHPAIHAGLLARRNRDDDRSALQEMGYVPVDLVAVNLYPFRETVARTGITVPDAMEQIDIGGPTLLRAAAKNHAHVWAVADPEDYPAVVEALDREAGADGERGEGLRRKLAARVFRHVSGYDRAVAEFLEEHAVDSGQEDRPAPGDEAFPLSLSVGLERLQTLRYGENPDQSAAFYAPEGERFGLARLEQRHGKDLSYNNLLDLDGALLSLAPFAFSRRPAVCIVKHTTPCGLAVGQTVEDAYRLGLRTDPMSAFGSVIALNRPVDAPTARAMTDLFVECVVAPGFSREAYEILAEKKALRLLTLGRIEEALPFEPPEDGWWGEAPDEIREPARFLAAHGRLPASRILRGVYGGMLAQTPPLPPFYGGEGERWDVVTSRSPTDEEWDDLRFAWGAIFGVKSNAILLAREGATLGIGAGQMSRVDASRIAVRKAGEAGLELEGAVLASDAFFPFRDGVDAAAEAGIRAVVQPGGSIRDDEVVAAADEHGIAMVLTGRRLFRH